MFNSNSKSNSKGTDEQEKPLRKTAFLCNRLAHGRWS